MEVNTTTLTLYENETSRTADLKTIHILGAVRGGTTAVAGIVRQMGIYLGDDLEENLEDPALAFGKDSTGAEAIIQKRNADHAVWGWKHPNSSRHLAALAPHLRNLRLIVVTRDVTANTIGLTRRVDGKEDLTSLKKMTRQTKDNLGLVEKLERPTLYVSYEKLVLRPKVVIRDIAAFCGVELSRSAVARISRSIHAGRYAKAPNMSWLTYLRRRVAWALNRD